MIPRWLNRLGPKTLLAALLVGGSIHIVATLAVPHLATGGAYGRLGAGLPANSMEVLAPLAPGNQPLPFMLPDTRYAVCRFDITKGAVRVTAGLPEGYWTVALYSPYGDNFFTLPAQPARRTQVDFFIVPSVDRLFSFQPGSRVASDIEGVTVPSQYRQGLIVIRAPLAGLAFAADTEAALAQARCALRPD